MPVSGRVDWAPSDDAGPKDFSVMMCACATIEGNFDAVGAEELRGERSVSDNDDLMRGFDRASHDKGGPVFATRRTLGDVPERVGFLG